MAPLNWKKLMAVDAESMETEEADDYYRMLEEYDPEDEMDPKRLKKLFSITQAVMQIKGTQAELAEEEIDKMAGSQGKMLAKKEQDLLDEIEELKTEVKQLKRYGSDTAAGGSTRDTRYLRDEIHELERQNEVLQREKGSLEKELSNERRASDRFATRAEDAEKEARDLKKENDQMQEDIRDYQRQLESQRETMIMKRGEDTDFRDKMTKKNREIVEALEEIQNLTDLNDELRKQHSDMKQKVEEAITQMDKTTEEYMKLKMEMGKTDSIIDKFRKENEILKGQVEDLTTQVQSRTDADDDIMVKVNEKVEEWKVVLADKDMHIADLQEQVMGLREQLIASNMDMEKNSVSVLTKAVEERDKQIVSLQDRLDQAVLDLEANTALMEDFKVELKKGGKEPSDRQMQKLIQLQETVRFNDVQLKDADARVNQAETDARDKDRQLSEALERMRQYEAGEYGLAEAVAEIKEQKTQVGVRDRQIEDLTKHVNQLEMKINDIYDENEELRDRLGLDPKEPIDLTDYKKKKNVREQEERALNRILREEVERLEEERIELKKHIRKLAQQSGQRAVALGLSADDILAIESFTEELAAKRKEPVLSAQVIKAQSAKDELQLRNVQLDRDLQKNADVLEKTRQENVEYKAKVTTLEEDNKKMHEAFREMKEKLEEIRVSSGDDVVTLECPALEKMLAALDAKQFKGQYDVSMYLKAQVDNLTGRNEELRKEMRETRHETNKANLNLERANAKILKLEEEAKTLREVGAGAFFQTMSLPEGMAATSSDVIASLNEHLIQTLQELSLKEEMISKMETSLEVYKRKFAVMRHQQGLLYQDYLKDKKEWEDTRQTLEEQLKELDGLRQEDQARIQEFDRLVDTLSQDEAEVRRRLADITRKMTVLRVNEKALTRRYNSVTEMETTVRKENVKLKNDTIAMEAAITERLGYLQRYKDMAAFKISALQKTLDNSTPASELEAANRHYTELTEKYRDLLDRENSLVAQSESLAGYETEIKRLQNLTSALQKELSIEKEKLHTLEGAMEKLGKKGLGSAGSVTDNDIISFSHKLTTLEIKELNERQRADHAQNMYDQQRSTLRRLEDRNIELEHKFAELTKMNLAAQKTERELRDELANCVTKSVSDADRKRNMELEKSEANLKEEVSKLKEICEVATMQTNAFSNQQTSRDKEMTSLRQQLLDFQAQSDEKTVIGKLHRHIVQLQVSEGTAVQRLQEAEKKLKKQQAQILRLEQRLDEKDGTIYHNRQEAQSKSRYLKRIIQELRRQFSGSVPLSKQEKFAQNLLKLQEDKNKMEAELKKVNEQRLEVEDKLAALELQHNGLQELIQTLKDGKGAQKVADWHEKMEAIRLDDLKLKRQISRCQQQIKYLDGVIRSQELEISNMDADNVRLAKDFEERQLLWEQREVELERIIAQMEKQQAEIAGAASQFEVAAGAFPDTSLPVANQLEIAIATIKKNVKVIVDTRAEAQVVKKRSDELESRIKDLEKQVTARDKVITDLRLRLPATAERDEVILKATAQSLGAQKEEDDFESRQALRVAQSTVSSLQQRITQKEETIQKYQELLKQAREDMHDMNKRNEEEMKLMQSKLHSKSDAVFSKFKEQVIDVISKKGQQVPTNKQLARLNELEDTVAEQDNAMAALTDKLKEARNETLKVKQQMDSNLKQSSQEKEQLISEHEIALGKLHNQIDGLKMQIKEKDRETEVVKHELELQTEANTRAPTTTMKNLVERLKNQLALKEKQHKALSKALMELRADMVSQAQEIVKVHAEENRSEGNVQKIVDKHTKELRDQLDELQAQNQKLRKENRKRKEKDNSRNSELEELQQELNKKDSQVKKLRDDKERLEQEVTELEKKVERMSTMKSQKSGESESKQQEIESLRRKLRMKEDELKRAVNQAEKPYESKEGKEKGEEAIARWEERKKWQKTVERLREQLGSKEQDVGKVQRAHEMTKHALDRANRDKDSLESRLRLATKGGPPSKEVVSHTVQDLRRQNYELEEEMSRLKHQLTVGRDAAYEELQLRNKYLNEKLQDFEQQVTRESAPDQGSVNPPLRGDHHRKEDRLQQQIIQLSEENIELRFEVEQAKKDIPRLKDRIEDLQKYVEVLKAEAAHQGTTARSFESNNSSLKRIGESGKTTRELEKTIALLKKVVERTQAENEQLKKAPGVVSNDQLQMLHKENQGLKSQLDDMRQKIGSSLSERYTTSQKGTAKMMNDYDKLRRELLKETEANEKLRIENKELAAQVGKLHKGLDETKDKLDIQLAKQPTLSSMDTKGWKSVVVTRMYEEKMKALQEDLEKKNKMLADTKLLLRDAAQREQQLKSEHEELSQKVAVLERFPPFMKNGDMDVGREYQQLRLTVDRLECEKKELMNQLRLLRQHPGAMATDDVNDEDFVNKLHSHDKLMSENVELRTELRAGELEQERLKTQVEKMKKELENFGPEFFEEIEDLKYNYRESVQRNVQYEEQLSQLSKQFGVSLSIPGL